MLAGLVRDAARGAARAPTAGRACARSRRRRSRQNYYFKKYGKNALHGVFLVPDDLPSTISAIDAAVRGRRAARHQEGRGVRHQRARDAARLHLRRAGHQDRTTRRSRKDGADYVSNVFLRKEAQVQGVNIGEGLGLLVAVLRPALDLAPAARRSRASTCGCRSCPSRTRATTPSSTTSCSTTPRPTRSVRRRGLPVRCSRPRSTRSSPRAARTGSPAPAMFDAIHGITNFDDNGFIAPTNIGGQVGEQVPDRDAGAERQVRAGRPDDAGQVRLHRRRRSPSRSTR